MDIGRRRSDEVCFGSWNWHVGLIEVDLSCGNDSSESDKFGDLFVEFRVELF